MNSYLLVRLSFYVWMTTSLNDMLASSHTTSSDIRNRLEQEDQTRSSSHEAALAAIPSKPPRPMCLNCEKVGHCTEFCIAPGGQMASKTIEEARAACDAAWNKQRATEKPHSGRSTTSTTTNATNTAMAHHHKWTALHACLSTRQTLPMANSALSTITTSLNVTIAHNTFWTENMF